MSEVSRFFGIVIAVYFREHGVPHFHAKYGEFRGSFSIANLELLEGQLPNRVVSLVLEWAFQHRPEPMEDWELACAGKPLKRIVPLE